MTLPNTQPRNHAKTRLVLWLTPTILIYLASRIYAMTHIPVFLDEAIHLDWARPSLDSLPAPQGFQGRWLTIKIFSIATAFRWPFHDLLASRLTVALIGLSTIFACYMLARELFSSRVAIICVALYVVLPFTLIYTSLAMTDGIQLALASWTILFSVRLARFTHWSDIIILPLVLIAAVLAKFSGFLLVVVPVLAILVFAPSRRWPRLLLRAAPAVLAPVVLFLAFHRLGILAIFEHKMIRDSITLERSWMNLVMAGDWLWGLLTPIIAILAIVGIAWLLFRQRSRVAFFVVALIVISTVPYVIAAESWYPRYLLLSVVPIMLAVSYVSNETIALAQRHWRTRKILITSIALTAVLLWPTLRSAAVLFDLPRAGIPEEERYQLVTGWPSGYGVKELADFLKEQSEKTEGGIAVARLHWWDQPLQGLNIYLADSASVSLYTIDEMEFGSVRSLAHLSTRQRTLFVLTTEHGEPMRLPDEFAVLLKCGRPIWFYTRPGNMTGLAVYELACAELSEIPARHSDVRS